MTGSDEYADRISAWAVRLQAGEPITWAAFRRATGDTAAAADPNPVSGPLPGSAQLELTRRLAALHADRPLPRFAALAELVLATQGPGRGLVDPPLPWDAEGDSLFGAAPVEPDDLPGNELVRAACGVLVPLLLRAPDPASPVRSRPWRARLRGRRRFVVAGSPLTARAVREALLAAGWTEGGPGATRLVLGRDLETMMLEHWVARTRAGAERRWRPLWRRAATIDRLPPRLRLDEVAARLASEHGASSVHLVLGDGAAIEAGVRAATGARISLPRTGADPRAADLLRRLNPFVVMAGGAGARERAVAGGWTDALARADAEGAQAPPAPGLGAPPGVLRWARETAARMAEQASAAGRAGDYAVRGVPGSLVPERAREVRRSIDPDDVFALATRMIAALWRHEAATEGDS